MARRPLEGSAYWRQEDPLGTLADFDPIKEVTAQARAQRKGERFTPFEERIRSNTVPPSPVPAVVAPSASSGVLMDLLMDLLRRANADPNLSRDGLKVLLAVLTHSGQAPISLSQFRDATGIGKNQVIAGIRNALDAGYLTRSQFCPRCEAALPFSEDQKTMPCPSCHRQVPPHARYTVTDECVQNTDDTVPDQDRAVPNRDSPVLNRDSPPVPDWNSPVSEQDSPVPGMHSPPVLDQDRGAVPNQNSLEARVKAITSKMASHAVPRQDSPVPNRDRAVPDQNSPRARADSDSESNITNDSDSEYMRNGTGSGNGAGKSETELLAQASCKALETGAGSLGMHIKAWAHARQIDAKTGGKAHQTALQVILRELAAQRKETGQAQGKAWTRRVVDYFEGQGVPLMTGKGAKS